MLNTSSTRKKHKPLTDRDYARDLERQKKNIESLTMFADLGDEEKTERIKRALADPFYFYQTYLPHFFSDPEPADWHEEFVRDLARTDELIAITAQRGGAKSTIIFGEIIRWIAFKMHRLIVYRLDSLDKATSYTERILVEFQYNKRLQNDFGVLVKTDAAKGDFSCFDPETRRTITRVVAYGANMSLRGFINEDTRPDVIISEDIQDREAAESEKRTNKELRRLLRDARPALTNKDWKFIVVGNIICTGSVMDELLHDKKFTSFIKRRYPAEYRDEFGVRRSTWESRFPIAELDKLKFQIGDDAYEVEYLCQAVEVGTVFKPKRDIHHWRELPQEFNPNYILVQVDPALSGTNDYTAIGVFATYTHSIDSPDYNRWSTDDGRPLGEGVYTILLDVFCRKAGIDETLDACYEYFERWRATDFRCDGSVDKEIVFERFFAQYEVKTGKRLPVKFDKFSISKDARIKAMQPHMQRRRVLLPPHAGEDMHNFLKQLSRYGKSGEPDDAPDMLAAAIENCDPSIGNRKTQVYML